MTSKAFQRLERSLPKTKHQLYVKREAGAPPSTHIYFHCTRCSGYIMMERKIWNELVAGTGAIKLSTDNSWARCPQ